MRLIAWDEVRLRIDGERFSELLCEKIAESGAPVENLTLNFGQDEAEVQGRFRGLLGIPFRMRLLPPRVESGFLRIPIEILGVLGAPMEKLLEWFAPADLLEGRVLLDREEPAILIDIESFLPDFVDLESLDVRFEIGGILVETGPGSADLPPGSRDSQPERDSDE